jgi:hypothetical protein
MKEGAVEATPDGWRVHFERQLTRSADVVWALLNAGPHQPVVGGPVPPAFTTNQIAAGRLTTAKAPVLLEYEWLSDGRPAGTVRWALGQGTGHGAHLVLTQTGPAEQASIQTLRGLAGAVGAFNHSLGHP